MLLGRRAPLDSPIMVDFTKKIMCEEPFLYEIRLIVGGMGAPRRRFPKGAKRSVGGRSAIWLDRENGKGSAGLLRGLWCFLMKQHDEFTK